LFVCKFDEVECDKVFNSNYGKPFVQSFIFCICLCSDNLIVRDKNNWVKASFYILTTFSNQAMTRRSCDVICHQANDKVSYTSCLRISSMTGEVGDFCI